MSPADLPRSHHREGRKGKPQRKNSNARRYPPIEVDGHRCEVCEVCQEPVGYWKGAGQFVPGGGRLVHLHAHCTRCLILVGPLHEQKGVNAQGLCEVCALPGMDQMEATCVPPTGPPTWPPEAMVAVREGLNRGHPMRLL